MPSTIHLWTPGLEETGGIQHYSKCCIQALRELFPKARLKIFAKNDLHSHPAEGFRGFGRFRGVSRTLAFTGAGFMAALLERPDFILATHPHFMKALAPLERIGIRCLTAAHGIEVWGQMQGRLGQALRAATAILPVSKFTRDIIHREAGVPLEKLAVVPNTFREEQFSPGPKSPVLLQRYGLHLEQPLILTIGRLSASERYKGQDQVLQAMPALLKHLPDLHYLIGGCGDDESRLRQLAAELGVHDHVTFTGFVPDSELAEHYRLADLYVMPSTGEGFGIVYLESLACGRPCVVGGDDASPEAIDNGRLGFVVPPRDPAAIADAVLNFFRGQHDKPWLHQPETLHREVVKLYGQQAFADHLASALKDFRLSVF